MKISIITIVYNNQDHINSCIQSILSQVYRNIEYIVIDGNSSDGTVKKIMQYENQINIFHSAPDKGLYDALNKGIKIATGDVIGILHSDDVFNDELVIEDVVKEFKSSNADLLYGRGLYVEPTNIEKVKRVYDSSTYKRHYLYFGWIPLHTTIFVKKHIFEQFGTYNLNYSIASDYDISLRWFLNRDIKKHYFNRTIVRMRLGGKSTTAKLQKIKSKEDLEIINNYKLLGILTLFCKITRKIPQYIWPTFRKNWL